MEFQSGFHKLTFFFWIAASVVWFYALNSWWGIAVAIPLCVPAGVVTTLLPSMLLGTLRNAGVSDAVVTWLFVAAGLAVAVWGAIGFERVPRSLVVLAGAALVASGVGLLILRMNAMQIRYDRGELGADDAAFIEDVRRATQR